MKTKYIFIALFFGFVIACDEGFLDEEPFVPRGGKNPVVIIKKSDTTTKPADTTSVAPPTNTSVVVTDTVPPPSPTPMPVPTWVGYEKVLLTNREFINALIREGYAFVGDSLVKEEKFQQTTELNLSDAFLKTIDNIEVFSNLEKVNLSNNAFTSISFDFGKLPPKVQEVDLQDNELYEFENLAYTNYSTGEYKLSRRFNKIIFPDTARFNVEHTLAYYSTCNGCTMLYRNPYRGYALEPLTNLRYVPCTELFTDNANKERPLLGGNIDREILVDFREALVKEKQSIDLYKVPLLKEVFIKKDDEGFYSRRNNPPYLCRDERLEFWAYIINHPQSPITQVERDIFKPNYDSAGEKVIAKYDIPYIKVFKNVKKFYAGRLNIKHLDLTQATGVERLHILYSQNFKKLNLSHTQLFKNGVSDLLIVGCRNLHELVLPKRPITRIERFVLWGNPLTSHLNLNFSQVDYIHSAEFQLSGNLSVIFPGKINEYPFMIQKSGNTVGRGYIRCVFDNNLYQKYKKQLDAFNNLNPYVKYGVRSATDEFYYYPFRYD